MFAQARFSVERSVAFQLHTRHNKFDTTTVGGFLNAVEETYTSDGLLQWSEVDRRFHAQLTAMARMPQLPPVLKRYAPHNHRLSLSGVEVLRPFFEKADAGDEHRSLLQLISISTAKHAKKALSQHLGHVFQRRAPSLSGVISAGAFQC